MKNLRLKLIVKIVVVDVLYLFLITMFYKLLANYTHHGMKTVLDGIDISVTFDSNLDKAQEIVENIVTRHAKGYTELARKI